MPNVLMLMQQNEEVSIPGKALVYLNDVLISIGESPSFFFA
jgi:hypothetical protein